MLRKSRNILVRRFASIQKILFGVLLLLLTGCGEFLNVNTPTPHSDVIITAYPSFIIGELFNEDGCVRIKEKDTNVHYTLLWPPDVSVTVEGDQVNIMTGIVRKQPSEIVLHFGDQVKIGGGESEFPEKELLNNLSQSCKKPYWVIGFEVILLQSTRIP